MDNRPLYNSLNNYLNNEYSRKLYKLSLSGGMTCPNRDGKISSSGCIFCSEKGSGDFAASAAIPISEQIEAAKQLVSSKFTPTPGLPCYIAYFQSFTNTYAPVSKLRPLFLEAINHPDIAILSIATRPDCLGSDIIELLDELNHIKPVWVELGLQTSNEKSAFFINRGYKNEVFEDAVKNLNSINIKVITHLILGLPYETREDIFETIDYINKFAPSSDINIKKAYIWGLKLQLLHILKGTGLETLYNSLSDDERNEVFSMLDMDDYIATIADCVERLSPEFIIHRLTGDGDKKLLIAPIWSANKKLVLNTLMKELNRRNAK